ncbi:hypothetical protein E2C01_068087 [Portunus trituberculatus]|uniref:Sepiapterin reductase n=1 Tax=Portunus trituberculatus TaxID=210409 RepID=A0A5B7HMZ0_PORTR|nr:hypothetical protein [Portunus trituberculatus]
MVTGSSRGLGLEIVRQLAVGDNPPKVILATCRNPEKAPLETQHNDSLDKCRRRRPQTASQCD